MSTKHPTLAEWFNSDPEEWYEAMAAADDADGWCDLCHNTGEVDCYCGGDLCICMNHGTKPCPACDR